MIWAWDVQTSLPDFSRRYSAAALERGLLLRPISNTLYAMPPYLLDEEAVQHLAASALAALEDTLAQENHS
jgi:adenosylmethionine-8-amino-7-oxononanoate aminotransferase